MKMMVVGVMILAITGLAGDAFAAKSLMPAEKSLDDMNRRDAARFEQDQADRKKSGEPSEAAKEGDIRRGAEADAKMREQVKARKRGVAKQSHKANQDYLEKVRTGQVAKPAELGNPNYCVSRAVKLDRRRVFTDSELRHYVRDGHNEKEAFWITERDGAMMLVDPHISQNLR
jgi:hypothetical protein